MSPVSFTPPTLPLVRCAPGNLVTISGTDFGAAPGTLTLLNQGANGTSTTSITTASWSDTSLTFVCPDGATSGYLQVVNTNDSTQAQVPLRVVSQYVQSAEFIGQGIPIDDLAPGELDLILQGASGYADTFMGGTKRMLQTNETSQYHQKSRRVYPRIWPIESIDAMVFKISNQQIATINVADVILNPDLRYGEILSYTIANYALLGEIQNLGFAANILQITYTHGYSYLDYPFELSEAVKMIATEMLTERRIQAQGFGGFSSVKQGNQQYDRRNESFQIPQPAKELLRPFVLRRLN